MHRGTPDHHQTDATYDGAFEATANIKEGPELEAVYLFYI